MKMSRNAWAICATFALVACTEGHTVIKRQLIIDTTPEHLFSWLESKGYHGSLITGNRDKDCAPKDLMSYGVILKTSINNKPAAKSAVVCQNYNGEMRMKFD